MLDLEAGDAVIAKERNSELAPRPSAFLEVEDLQRGGHCPLE